MSKTKLKQPGNYPDMITVMIQGLEKPAGMNFFCMSAIKFQKSLKSFDNLLLNFSMESLVKTDPEQQIVCNHVSRT